MSRKIRTFSPPLLAILVALLTSAATARADIIFYSSGGTFSSTLQSLGIQDSNVLFNSNGAVNGPALTVTGVTNQFNLLVDTSSNENLTGLGGQAPAVAAQDGTFSNATLAFQNSNFLIHSLFFNLDNNNGIASSTVRFIVTDQNGQTSFTDIVNNGNNFFAVIASNGQFIQSASIQVTSSSSGTIDVLAQLKQIRISAVTAADGQPVHAPEPASWIFWLPAALLAAFFAYRRWASGPNMGLLALRENR